MTRGSAALEIVEAFFSALRPPQRRSTREFAEAELVLPSGPMRGLRFRCDTNPWSGPVLDEFDRDRYRRFFASGPAQAGKTLLFTVLPVMYHLFECGEDVILGVPVVDMGHAIYLERIRPSIEVSRYRELLPTSGAGSRGGRVLAIEFGNGATLRFMGAGGGDAQRSGHTARVVVLTELDKMDTPGRASRETDPVGQLEARASSFGEAARIYGECTLSTKWGRTWQEVAEIGTDSKVWLPCARCGEYSVPERAGLGGWQGAESILAARLRAKFTCARCGAEWTEDDRRDALRHPVIAAKGQRVAKGGGIEGAPPATNTFGFRWNAMANALVSMADLAEREWRAERTGNSDEEKALVQFVWSEPWEEKRLDVSGLTREMILAKIGKHPRGVVPDQAKILIVAIDLGLYRCWWMAAAFAEDARGYVVDYGALEVPQERQANPLAILTTLRAFREDSLRPGWQTASGAARRPDLVLVDSGYAKDVAYQFAREGGAPRVLPSKGLGSARGESSWRAPQPGPGREIGREWLLAAQPEGVTLFEAHSDHWKRQVHAGLAAPAGAPGSIELYRAEERDHLGVVRQLLAEHEEEEFAAGKGARLFWNRTHKDNHWLDCVYMTRAAADALGIRLVGGGPAPLAPRIAAPIVIRMGKRGVRTHYG